MTMSQLEEDRLISLRGMMLIKRFSLLEESDWSQLPDNALSAEKRAEWVTYRQALRDVPAQEGFPVNIQWPVRPT